MRGVLKRLHKITESGEGGHLKITLNIPLYPLVFQYFWELVSIYYTILWGWIVDKKNLFIIFSLVIFLVRKYFKTNISVTQCKLRLDFVKVRQSYHQHGVGARGGCTHGQRGWGESFCNISCLWYWAQITINSNFWEEIT